MMLYIYCAIGHPAADEGSYGASGFYIVSIDLMCLSQPFLLLKGSFSYLIILPPSPVPSLGFFKGTCWCLKSPDDDGGRGA